MTQNFQHFTTFQRSADHKLSKVVSLLKRLGHLIIDGRANKSAVAHCT